MLSKNTIKFIKSLHSGKFRKKHKLFVAEGPKIVDELIESNLTIKHIYAVSSWIQQHDDINPEIETTEISSVELKKISTLKTPNSVLAVVNIPDNKAKDNSFENELVIILDDIQDPGNLGTIIRTADWFGIKHIVCSTNTADVYNPKVIQATMGSFIRVTTIYEDLDAFFTRIPLGSNVYGALLKGENIYNTHLDAKGFVVIGNESKGISSVIKRFITHPLTIPPAGEKSTAESLNASVATGVVLSEFKRQQPEH